MQLKNPTPSNRTVESKPHHAASATAWMLDPEQTAWLATRDSTRIGPNGLGCRLRVTRERVRVIVGPAPRPGPMQPSR